MRYALAILALAGGCGGSSPPATPGADVLTNRYDNGRTGHLAVAGMNGPAVAAGHWGRLGVLPADGAIYAQPLYTEATPMADGKKHDVVYVASARNKIYAYDAGTLAPLWHDDLPEPDRRDETLRAPFSPLFPSPCTVMSPTWLEPVTPGLLGRREVGIGIQSTPVIDRAAGLLYVSYRTRPGSSPLNPAGGQAEQHLAAIRLADGSVARDQMIPASAFAPFTIEGTRQRASLLLQDGIIYVAFASHCEEQGAGFEYVGRVLAIDAATLALAGVFDVADPASGIVGGGIWQASSGLAADAGGDVYFASSNRQNQADDSAFTPSASNVVNSIVRLHPVRQAGSGGAGPSVKFITPSGEPGAWDWFTPYRAFWHNKIDLDLGSAGVLIPPGSHALVSGGKEGILYVLDRDHLGGLDDAHWGAAELAALRGGGYDCFSQAEALAWCDQAPPQSCSIADDADHDQRPGSQKIAAAENVECSVRGTPVRLGNWGQYPHFHGTPAYARLGDGRELMYFWPEKDHLKALRRDPTSPTLRFDPAFIEADVLAPARAMPGGFLTVVTDARSAGGVVFASAPQSTDIDAWGALLAFDAAPGPDGRLHQVWSAYDTEPFRFAKFVPPTIAAGKLFQATFSNLVAVYGPTAAPDQEVATAGVAALLRDPARHQVIAAVVEPSGQLAIFGESDNGNWARWASVGAPGQYPPGGAVALALENGAQVDLLAVDNQGALRVASQPLAGDARGPWAEAAVSAAGLYPPGAKVATVARGGGELDAFLAGSDGRLHQAWTAGAWPGGGAGTWPGGGAAAWPDRALVSDGSDPTRCLGAQPAVASQGPASEQLDVAAVDADGVLWVYATSAAGAASAGDAPWRRLDVLGGQRLFPGGAELVAARQPTLGADNQLDLFGVDQDGVVEVLSVIGLGDQWQRQALTGSNVLVSGAPPGAHLAVAHQGPLQLDVAVVGRAGTVQVYSAFGLGPWTGNETATLGLAVAGAPIALVPQNDGGTQLDALVARANGIFGIFTVGGAWLGPFRAL